MEIITSKQSSKYSIVFDMISWIILCYTGIFIMKYWDIYRWFISTYIIALIVNIIASFNHCLSKEIINNKYIKHIFLTIRCVLLIVILFQYGVPY